MTNNKITADNTGTVIHIDDRGYALVKHPCGGYSAGCRGDCGRSPISRAEALAHWGSPDYPNPERGQGFVDAIERDEGVAAVPEALWVLYAYGVDLTGVVLPAGLEVLRAYGVDLTGVKVHPRCKVYK